MNNNIITLTDSYKFGHHDQYPKDIEKVYSYFESRKGAKFDETVFVGLQYILKEYLEGEVITETSINEAEELSAAHFLNPTIFNRGMWDHILKKHDGRLPVEIKAVPEGTPIPTGNVMMTVENTDTKCFALTNHLETLLTHVWYASTVSTLSRECKKMMKTYLEQSADNLDALKFMLHDFGMRGVSSIESAGTGGLGHLVNFYGTDTVVAMETARDYYGADFSNLAFSVPATEHSVMTSRGPEGESDIVGQLLQTYPVGILSIVSDSYNIENFVKNYIGVKFKDRILNRNHPEIPCKVVIRPDSLRYEGDTPEDQMLWIAETLWDIFGGNVNSKGYRVFDSHIGMLWGDGIDKDGIDKILKRLTSHGFSAENSVFGMGGGLLQKINRDTQRFAFKCSAQQRSGQWIDIFKKPLDVSKASKKGLLTLVKNKKGYTTFESGDMPSGAEDVLQTVFKDGSVVKEYQFNTLRENSYI